MSDRSRRLFEIIQVLRGADAPIPARALAESLEVTKRTIYRDIVTLQATGIPIEGAAGIGYVMQAGYDLPPLMFSADEIEAIFVGLSLLGRTGDAGLQVAADRVSQKIASVLPNTAGRLIETTPLLVSRWTAVPPSGIDYRMIRQAVREENKLRLFYRNTEEQETERIICPLALIYYTESTVLAGWCELRRNFRHFRLDRIVACTQTGKAFKEEGAKLRAQWQSTKSSLLSGSASPLRL